MLLLLIRVFNDLDMETCVLRVDWEMKMLVMALEKAHASLTFGGAQYICCRAAGAVGGAAAAAAAARSARRAAPPRMWPQGRAAALAGAATDAAAVPGR